MSGKKWYAENREKVLAQKKAQYAADPEAKKTASAKYRANNADKVATFEKRRWVDRQGDADYRAQQADRARAWYAANKPRVAARNRVHGLKKKYGLTLDDFEQMRQSQGGGCAICRSTEEKLVVDHCHSTGKVRGLLCGSCNTGIGHLGDTAESVSRAVSYLRSAESEAKHA